MHIEHEDCRFRTAELPARSCNDPEHEARRRSERLERAGFCGIHETDTRDSFGICWPCEDEARGGTPCLVCGAPIKSGKGHDESCGLIAEVEPRCDICGEPDGEGEADWNGETGNHATCEAWS